MTYWHIIPKRYQSATFQTFKPQTSTQEEAYHFLKTATEKGLKQNVFLLGNCGSGKTHLCYSFLKACADPKKDNHKPLFCPSNYCFMTSLKEILDEIKMSFKGQPLDTDESLLQKAIEAPILILDEVGLQYGSEMERIELYRLFNERYNTLRPCILISNLPLNKLRPLFGKRICDRVLDQAIIFQFQNKSYRQEAPYETH